MLVNIAFIRDSPEGRIRRIVGISNNRHLDFVSSLNPRPILKRPAIALVILPLLALDAVQTGGEFVAQLVEAAAGLVVDLIQPWGQGLGPPGRCAAVPSQSRLGCPEPS
jgi:hypothetical protein